MVNLTQATEFMKGLGITLRVYMTCGGIILRADRDGIFEEHTFPVSFLDHFEKKENTMWFMGILENMLTSIEEKEINGVKTVMLGRDEF